MDLIPLKFEVTHYLFDTKTHFSFSSDIVRLGEYDLASLDDGEHVDIPIDRFDMHTNHTSYLVFHTLDVGLVYLKEHAKFNGNSEYHLFFLRGALTFHNFLESFSIVLHFYRSY